MSNVTSYDYSKLLGRMRELSVSQAVLARKIGICLASLNGTLNNKRNFSQREISAIKTVLNIDDTEVYSYFFTMKVQ